MNVDGTGHFRNILFHFSSFELVSVSGVFVLMSAEHPAFNLPSFNQLICWKIEMLDVICCTETLGSHYCLLYKSSEVM